MQLIAFQLLGQGQGRPAPQPTGIQRQASIYLKNLVETHPDQNLRENFNKWLTTKSLFISFESDIMPNEMATELVRINSKLVPVLVVNPDFLARFSRFGPNDRVYKQLVLIHEYTHIADHIFGKIFLRTGKFLIGENIASRAENIWQGEWSAETAEWNLAKKLNQRHLMLTIDSNIRKYGEQKGFLVGFYKLLAQAEHTKDKEALVSMRKVWASIYQKEIAKLER